MRRFSYASLALIKEKGVRQQLTFDLSNVKIIMRFDSANAETFDHSRGRLRKRGCPILGIPWRKLRIFARRRLIGYFLRRSSQYQHVPKRTRARLCRVFTSLLLLPPRNNGLGRLGARQPSGPPFLILGKSRSGRRRSREWGFT